MINWEAYFRAMPAMPVHPLLERSEPYLTGGMAVDLGCGAGQAAAFLTGHGYRVLAVDNDPRAIALTQDRCEGLPVELLEKDIRELDMPRCELVHCGFVLFFLSPEESQEVLARVCAAILPGGVFIGQFLGPNDTWVGDADQPLTSHSKAEIELLLTGFEFLHFEEVERDGKTAWGEHKHWHVTHVIAKRH